MIFCVTNHRSVESNDNQSQTGRSNDDRYFVVLFLISNTFSQIRKCLKLFIEAPKNANSFSNIHHRYIPQSSNAPHKLSRYPRNLKSPF